MFRQFVQAALVIVLAFFCCKAASAQMVLYDNFDASVINPAKWVGSQRDESVFPFQCVDSQESRQNMGRTECLTLERLRVSLGWQGTSF
jgi:hypothetical protein